MKYNDFPAMSDEHDESEETYIARHEEGQDDGWMWIFPGMMLIAVCGLIYTRFFA